MNSCYHCTRRKPGCHSVCEDYKQDCEEYEQRRAYERRFASVTVCHRRRLCTK